MSDISNIYSNVGATYDSVYTKNGIETEKIGASDNSKKTKIPGKTVGNPQLSETAKKYYEELRKKFHNMEFILVSEDEKENAKSKVSSYAQKNKMVVLIDEAKIEKMATDSSYRQQYESLIDKASNGFKEFAASVASTGADVKGYGMQVNNDGSVSYFAVLKEQGEAQTKRIAEKRAQKQAEKKKEAKKTEKIKREEQIEKSREARKNKSASKVEDENKNENSNDKVITANSLEELLQKLSDHVQMTKSDSVITEAEKVLGNHIDFSA